MARPVRGSETVVAEDLAGFSPMQREEFVRRLTSLIPPGRMASCDEYGAAVQSLCSDASTYLVDLSHWSKYRHGCERSAW